MEEIGKVLMKTKREQMNMQKYVWKLLLPECFIKLYVDHFGLVRKEANGKLVRPPCVRVSFKWRDCDAVFNMYLISFHSRYIHNQFSEHDRKLKVRK